MKDNYHQYRADQLIALANELNASVKEVDKALEVYKNIPNDKSLSKYEALVKLKQKIAIMRATSENCKLRKQSILAIVS